MLIDRFINYQNNRSLESCSIKRKIKKSSINICFALNLTDPDWIGWIWGEGVQVSAWDGKAEEPAVTWSGPGGGPWPRAAHPADHAAAQCPLRPSLHHYAHGCASSESDFQGWARRGQRSGTELLHGYSTGFPVQWQAAQSGLCTERQQGNAG